ncbi:hypothetical protein OU994_17420 [Pseudoduganella sp. SL102]|uniref:hypothetical protein n=1 Tax=Pseudoduganella sp. SL102 TaxID=2995154 RepID=UPI00248B953B|nr:hypothetical protein [Pseudoduganella sp. SL102]WBS00103.1 hypothetical protein OU994_17420 [Pseudoduganella sp. SL102]
MQQFIITMNRRKDLRTAELIGIAVLTRDAFGIDRAYRYAILAGLSGTLTTNVLTRNKTALRHVETITGPLDRRQISNVDNGKRCREDFSKSSTGASPSQSGSRWISFNPS